MSRIRSVHPGLFTDEAFVTVSDAAQIFYIGLLTEADDQGVFEWKPITLKMRLRAATTQPVDGLLAELETADKIAKYEIAGRQYGVIRNFRKFQRPKSPNAIHPIPGEWRNYVGLSAAISETDDNEDASFSPKGEKSPQMEDEGSSRRKDEGEHANPATTSPHSEKPALERNGSFQKFVGLGSGISDSGQQWSSQQKRDEFAATALIPHLPGRDDGERWALALAAEDPQAPEHEAACRAMRMAAKKAGVGWVSPERRLGASGHRRAQ